MDTAAVRSLLAASLDPDADSRRRAEIQLKSVRLAFTFTSLCRVSRERLCCAWVLLGIMNSHLLCYISIIAWLTCSRRFLSLLRPLLLLSCLSLAPTSNHERNKHTDLHWCTV